MSTYVIGDVHGCAESLFHLLECLRLQDGDQLWCVGDLINRGPYSLSVIEWAMHNQDRVQIVLGNHELHFLACLFGAQLAKGDTLDELLNLPANKREEVCNWLRQQPIMFEAKIAEKWVAMVHAGINPQWSWAETRDRARSIEEALQSDHGLEALAYAHPSRKNVKGQYRNISIEKPQWVEDLKWFTRVRTIDQRHKAVGWFKGNPTELPKNLSPWFNQYQVQHSSTYPDMLYYGHWAAFGLQAGSCYFGLDSGCIWGNHLSAIRIDDDTLFKVTQREIALVPKHLRRS